MKRTLTTNSYMYQVCIPAINETKIQGEVNEIPILQEPSSCNRCFEELLLESVDEELSLLGEAVKQAVYHNMKKAFKIDRQAIPHRIDQFAKAIERMFGDGAKLLEIQIMKRLYEKLDHNVEYSPQSSDLLFTEYVEVAKWSKHR